MKKISSDLALAVLMLTTLGYAQSGPTNGTQVFAWTGTDSNHSLNVQIGLDGEVTTLNEYSNNGPAIARFHNLYYLAWTGTGGHLNYATSADGRTWSEATTLLGEESNLGPTLVVSPSGATIYLGWTGTDRRLNYVSSTGGVFGNKQTTNQTSPYAYSLLIVH